MNWNLVAAMYKICTFNIKYALSFKMYIYQQLFKRFVAKLLI